MESQVLKSGCEKLGIFLNEKQESQFIEYYKMLIEWNQVMNLTAITEFEDVVQKHFVDSLSIIQVNNLRKVDNVIDIGTGAGFPGIPLKIMYPHVKVTLLDSLRKRIDFLNHVTDVINLKDVEAIHGRAEDYAKPGQKREQYDLCVSRAVANLSTLSEYCLPFVKKGGFFISYKSEKISEEMAEAENAIVLLGGKAEEKKEFLLPDSDIYRCLFVIKKVRETPKKYPRKAGLPGKEPLR